MKLPDQLLFCQQASSSFPSITGGGVDSLCVWKVRTAFGCVFSMLFSWANNCVDIKKNDRNKMMVCFMSRFKIVIVQLSTATIECKFNLNMKKDRHFLNINWG
jgi:hypothetical protein